MISVKELLQQSWKSYESNFGKILKITVWGFIVTCLSTAIIYCVETFFKGTETQIWLLSSIANVPQVLVAYWVSLALIDFFGTVLEKKKTSASESMKRGLELFFPAVLVSILAGLANAAGFLLFIVPGIIFTVWFAFGVYGAVLENKRGTNALKESKKLSEGRWFAVAWRYFAPVVLWSFAGWLSTSILALSTRELLNLINTTLDAGSAEILILVLSICQNAFYIFFVPLMIASAVLLYKDLKRG